MYSIFKRKVKASISKWAPQWPQLHILFPETRWTTGKNVIKTNHRNPTNQISSNNHSGHRQTNQLMPEFSSTNNPGTIPAQTKTSTIVIPKTAIGRIIGRKGNKINKIQSQSNVVTK